MYNLPLKKKKFDFQSLLLMSLSVLDYRELDSPGDTSKKKRRKQIIIGIIVALVLFAIVVIIAVVITSKNPDTTTSGPVLKGYDVVAYFGLASSASGIMGSEM